MVAYTQMIPLGFYVGIDNLVVEKLRGRWPTRNLPFIEIQQSAKETELSLLVEDLGLHKVRELSPERLDTLLKSREVGFDLRPQQGLHVVIGELRPQFTNRPSGIAEEAGERRAYAGLRPRSFKDDAVEDFYLIEMVALGFKEPAPLVDGGFHNGVLIRSEWNLGPVALEEILVDVEAGTKCL
jgi:hypothetical protein